MVMFSAGCQEERKVLKTWSGRGRVVEPARRLKATGSTDT